MFFSVSSPIGFEHEVEPTVHVIANAARYADSADRTCRFEPCSDVDAIAMQVRAIWNHITDVDAYSEADAPIRRLVAVVHPNLLLHLDRTSHRAIDAVERDQQRVAAGLHHSSAALPDRRVDQRAPQCAQTPQCAGIIEAN